MKRMRKALSALFVSIMMIVAMSTSAFAAGISNSNDALKLALKNAGLNSSQVKVLESEYDDGVYEVEFINNSNGNKYSYEIKRSSGKIVEKSIEIKHKRNSSHKKIGKKAARKKAAKYSGVKYKKIKKCKCRYEYDDGEGVYEVKFKKGNYRYECEVLAPTGQVIEYSWEMIKK